MVKKYVNDDRCLYDTKRRIQMATSAAKNNAHNVTHYDQYLQSSRTIRQKMDWSTLYTFTLHYIRKLFIVA